MVGRSSVHVTKPLLVFWGVTQTLADYISQCLELSIIAKGRWHSWLCSQRTPPLSGRNFLKRGQVKPRDIKEGALSVFAQVRFPSVTFFPPLFLEGLRRRPACCE